MGSRSERQQWTEFIEQCERKQNVQQPRKRKRTSKRTKGSEVPIRVSGARILNPGIPGMLCGFSGFRPPAQQLVLGGFSGFFAASLETSIV